MMSSPWVVLILALPLSSSIVCLMSFASRSVVVLMVPAAVLMRTSIASMLSMFCSGFLFVFLLVVLFRAFLLLGSLRVLMASTTISRISFSIFSLCSVRIFALPVLFVGLGLYLGALPIPPIPFWGCWECEFWFPKTCFAKAIVMMILSLRFFAMRYLSMRYFVVSTFCFVSCPPSMSACSISSTMMGLMNFLP